MFPVNFEIQRRLTFANVIRVLLRITRRCAHRRSWVYVVGFTFLIRTSDKWGQSELAVKQIYYVYLAWLVIRLRRLWLSVASSGELVSSLLSLPASASE
jgi:hypothetical protein